MDDDSTTDMKNFDWIVKEVYMVALLVCHCFNKGIPSLLLYVLLFMMK